MSYIKEINMKNRKELADYLTNHPRYNTMNSWNLSTSYAQNVKLYNLDIPKEIEDKAYNVICDDVESPDLKEIIDDEFDAFRTETGYVAGFNGRSGGYIVMYDTEYNDKGELCVYPGRSIDASADFYDKEEWSLEELQERARVVQRFDLMCENIRTRFIELLEHSEIEECEVMIPVTRKQLVIKD